MARTIKKALTLDKLNALTNKQVLGIITGLALVVFFVGLHSPFQGDDNYQIVNNLPVHSIKKIGTLLSSSTFYDGQQLTGPSYRPMMTITFAFIYTLFKASPPAFHIVQLGFFVMAAFMTYLVFKRFFKPWQALICALVLLVHPLNSQAAFAIPSLQDALFMAFGMLALWLMLAYKSTKAFLGFASCLFLALLAKEIAILFVVVVLVYLMLFDKKRIKTFFIILVAPIALYAVLRINAVGVIPPKTFIAPIDHLGFVQRLYTVPSILQFYFTKFLMPWKLATRYFWTYPTFSAHHVLLPLGIDILVIGLVVYTGRRVKNRHSKKDFKLFALFGLWAGIGLLPYLQLYPIDMTASPSWFYFSMVGVLGMITVTLKGFRPRFSANTVVGTAGVIILALAISTAVQGTYYKSAYALAQHDLSASKEDYAAMSDIAQGLLHKNRFKEAAAYAQQSIDAYPTLHNYQNLGVALQSLGDFGGAIKAYSQALRYGHQSTVYENLGLIALQYNNPTVNDRTFQEALKAYPQNFKLWLYLALYEDQQGHNDNAKKALLRASMYGQIPTQISTPILNDLPFTLQLPNAPKPFVVQ